MVVVEVTLVLVELVSEVDVERELPLDGGRDVETDIDTEVGGPDEVRGVGEGEGVSNDVNCWRRERARDDSDADVLVIVGTDITELELDEGSALVGRLVGIEAKLGLELELELVLDVDDDAGAGID